MLGDTAIAVAPNDDRYQAFVGSHAIHPLTQRSLPIIADRFVDPTFGTGALKVTPAHDHNDYQLAQTHQLPIINIMTPDGKINETRKRVCRDEHARGKRCVVAAMKEKGLLVKVEPHHHRVGISYRSKAVIEPYLSKQWFVNMGPLKAKTAQPCRRSKTVRLIPETWENTYFHWIDNLRDWCISQTTVVGAPDSDLVPQRRPKQMFC